MRSNTLIWQVITGICKQLQNILKKKKHCFTLQLHVLKKQTFKLPQLPMYNVLYFT